MKKLWIVVRRFANPEGVSLVWGKSCHPFRIGVPVCITAGNLSSPNPAQMRILKRVFVFQAIAQDAVEAGVAEEERPGEHQPGD